MIYIWPRFIYQAARSLWWMFSIDGCLYGLRCQVQVEANGTYLGSKTPRMSDLYLLPDMRSNHLSV